MSTPDFQADLTRYGPGTNFRTISVDEAFSYCERLARSHYENFTVASFLLPKPLRKSFYAVYAYCRWADDLGDETGGGENALRLLDWWNAELDRCYENSANPVAEDAGAPVHPVFTALGEVFREHRLSRQPFADLLVAFRRDQEQNRYENFADLLDYCRYSANPVGRIILELAASVWNTAPPSPEQLAWSDAICTGLQLANHWQDLSRDRTIDRLYLPTETMRQFDLSRDAQGFPEDGPAFRRMMRFLVDDAEERLLSGRALPGSLPRPLRLDIRLFLEGGLAILREIRRIDFDVLNHRPSVSKPRKLFLLLRCAILRSR